jgi:predicted site-specific integrase-resolvase
MAQVKIGEQDCLLRPRDVARFFSVAVATLRYWRSLGRGPEFLRIGDRIRYSPEALRRFMRSARLRIAKSARK